MENNNKKFPYQFDDVNLISKLTHDIDATFRYIDKHKFDYESELVNYKIDKLGLYHTAIRVFNFHALEPYLSIRQLNYFKRHVLYTMCQIIDTYGACLCTRHIENYVFSTFFEPKNKELIGLFNSLESAMTYIRIVNQYLDSKDLPHLYVSGSIIYSDFYKDFIDQELLNTTLSGSYEEEKLRKLIPAKKIYNFSIFTNQEVLIHYYKNQDDNKCRYFDETGSYIYNAGKGLFEDIL